MRALPHDLVGNRGGRHGKDAVDGRIDIFQAGETGRVVYRPYLWIHRNRIVPPLTQYAKKPAREVLGIVGDTNDSDPLLRQEVLDCSHRTHALTSTIIVR
jgi:hypothetical protein